MSAVNDLFEGKSFEVPKRHRCLKIVVTGRCSLRCPYCVSNLHLRQGDVFLDEVGAAEFLRLLDAITTWGPDLRVSLGGAGEPTESKEFVHLARGLLDRGAFLHIGTNLRGMRAIETLGPLHGRAEATVSYHAGAMSREQRDRFVSVLWPRAIAAGLPVGTVVTPMTPDLLAEPEIYLAEADILLSGSPATRIVPIELYHVLDGKPFPESYTKGETAALAYLQRSFGYEPARHGLGDADGPTPINQAAIPHLVNFVEVPGQLCAVRMFSATITRSGDIESCRHYPPSRIGHLRDDPPSALFEETPAPCPARRSGCKAICNAFCLEPHGVGLASYFEAWHRDRGDDDVASLFSEHS